MHEPPHFRAITGDSRTSAPPPPVTAGPPKRARPASACTIRHARRDAEPCPFGRTTGGPERMGPPGAMAPLLRSEVSVQPWPRDDRGRGPKSAARVEAPGARRLQDGEYWWLRHGGAGVRGPPYANPIPCAICSGSRREA